MNGCAVHYFSDQEAQAVRLADLLGASCAAIAVHRFPDGESLVRVEPSASTALVYCGLDHPNERLVELMLSVSALRDTGAERLVLVAPYMCYMRQDTAFHRGEAISQKAVGRFLAGMFDRIVTVDPHLHRTERLDLVFAGIATDQLSAAAAIGEAIIADGAAPDTLLVGPDRESRQWVQAAATAAGLDFIIGEKIRAGDRSVTVSFPEASRATGRPVVIVDDLVSSGGTLCEAARVLVEAGASRIEAIAVHALFGEAEAHAMRAAGIERIRSTDTVVHPTNAIMLAPLLAHSLANEVPECP